MKKGIAIAFITITILALFGGGCGAKKASAPDNAVVVDTSKVSGDQAQWDLLKSVVDGKAKGTPVISDEQKDKVTKAKDITKKYISEQYTGDYRTADGKAGIEYLSQNAIKKATNKEAIDAVLKEIKEWQYISKNTSLDIKYIALSKDGMKCVLKIDAGQAVTSATDTYFNTYHVVKGKTYHLPGYVFLVQENNIWKIEGYNTQSLEDIAKVESTK